jgi:hypothetical protein
MRNFQSKIETLGTKVCYQHQCEKVSSIYIFIISIQNSLKTKGRTQVHMKYIREIIPN